jgi:hypothetical protein
MKKKFVALTIAAVMALGLASCGDAPAAEIEPAAGDEEIVVIEAEEATTEETPTAPMRADGERYDAVITIEGMEETVHYEHIVNTALGFEMDYDYERFLRQSDGDRERFVSTWDDPANPENYLELSYSPESAETTAAAIIEELSRDYDITRETRELEYVGEVTWIEASVIKGTNNMADQLQWVYIIPANDGCIVARAHSFVVESEGFGRRFSDMMQTLAVRSRAGDGALTDELALTAIQKYCYSSNPDLEGIVNGGEYQVGWEIASSSEQEVVVLFRSYTGAEIRYYIDRSTGETYATEFVPGVTAAEERTEESFNLWDYAG